jgi:hypothetical protein
MDEGRSRGRRLGGEVVLCHPLHHMPVFLRTPSRGTVNEEEPCIARAPDSGGGWSGWRTSEVSLTAKRATPEAAASRMSAGVLQAADRIKSPRFYPDGGGVKATSADFVHAGARCGPWIYGNSPIGLWISPSIKQHGLCVVRVEFFQDQNGITTRMTTEMECS